MMRNNTPARSRSSTYFSTTSPRGNPAGWGEQQKAVKHMYKDVQTHCIPTFDTVTNMTYDACSRMFWLEAMRHVLGGISRCVGSVVLPNDSLRQRNPLTTKHPGIPTPTLFFCLFAQGSSAGRSAARAAAVLCRASTAVSSWIRS